MPTWLSVKEALNGEFVTRHIAITAIDLAPFARIGDSLRVRVRRCAVPEWILELLDFLEDISKPKIVRSS